MCFSGENRENTHDASHPLDENEKTPPAEFFGKQQSAIRLQERSGYSSQSLRLDWKNFDTKKI